MSETRDGLDGNALGGLLQELFGAEMTGAPHTCQARGAVRNVPSRRTACTSAPERSFAARSAIGSRSSRQRYQTAMWCTSPGRGGWRCPAPSWTRQRRTTMASPATSSHLPALAEPHEREAIADELQSTMQELVDLSLIGKQLHWAVVGHAFRPVHAQLDELVASARSRRRGRRARGRPRVRAGLGKLEPSRPDHRCRHSRPRQPRATPWYGPSPTGSRRSAKTARERMD